MHNQTWLLIDCNNFFVSCERVFRPDLWNQPTLVLSCNDGCVVSRSNEVKALKIPMGAPYFQIKDIVKKNKIHVFSSNFRLYANLSHRVMETAREFAPHKRQEVYSIDECFLDLSEFNFNGVEECEAYGAQIRKHILTTLGIPVTVGIASSKTLAKLATEIAKKDVLGDGVLSLKHRSPSQIQTFLKGVAINDVWGIGRKSAKFLLEQKINTAEDFYNLEQNWVKKHLKLGGEKTWLELHEQACILQEDAALTNKALICSRTFGQTVQDFAELQSAVATFTAQAAERLRRHHFRASFLTVYINTSRFIEPEKRYSASYTLALPQSTAFTPDLVTTAAQALKKIYRPNFLYKRAGITCSGLEQAQAWQPTLLNLNSVSATPYQLTNSTLNPEEEQVLMRSFDRINHQYGDQTIRLASQGMKFSNHLWQANSQFRSPHYLHSWTELPEVK